MPNPTYPTLSVKPDKESWDEGPLYDPVVRTGMDGGAQESWPSSTVVPKYWAFVYRDMPNADKVLLEDFEKKDVRYGGEFDWPHPFLSETHAVTFGQKLDFKLENTQQLKWRVAVKLIEANPTSD